MHRPHPGRRYLSIAFGRTLHQRVVAVAVLVCVVAVGTAAVLIDTRHSRMVLDKVTLEGAMLVARLSEARIAHDVRPGTRRLRVVLAQRFESLFRFDEGRSAFITLGDEVMWQSDSRLGRPPSFDSSTRGDWEGIVTISHPDRTHEAYLVRRNQKGFMHSLSHLLSAIPLTEFKTIPEDEKEAVHKDFMRVRRMIERKLHDLVVKGSSESERSADVVCVAREFFTPNEYSGQNFLQSFMRRRHPDRSFAGHHFSMRHEEEPLHAGIDRSHLYELMFNLLHNAGKAANGQVRMSIACRGEMVRIVVENDGAKFPSAGRERLMVWKDSKAGERTGEGHGIGLPYVRRVARDHHGDLYLGDSDELGGARVVLELPLADAPAASAAGNGASDDAVQRPQPKAEGSTAAGIAGREHSGVSPATSPTEPGSDPVV